MAVVNINGLAEEWGRFESWLRENAPVTYRTLLPPADVEAIHQITGGRFAVHSDLGQLLLLHDGFDSLDEGGAPEAFLPQYYAPYSARRAAIAYSYMLRNIDLSTEDGTIEHCIGQTLHPEWVPFARTVSGDELVVDHRAGDTYGAVLQYSEGDGVYQMVWPSLGAMIAEMNAALRGEGTAGGYHPRLHADSLSLEWYHPRFP
ncbi:SMI1/KNR4 family protein [Streptomyces sp. BR1]|uniref:SMI1/KNR4 family protein n=1 Tax=Streptomyces sp. BR1 TaxID=1592323 RepID=UPI00402B9874